jgi:hypothetical protein
MVFVPICTMRFNSPLPEHPVARYMHVLIIFSRKKRDSSTPKGYKCMLGSESDIQNDNRLHS